VPECPANSHLEYMMSGCPATCADPTASNPEFCAEPHEIGCACDEGFVLDGDSCVPHSQCGCLKDGMYFTVRAHRHGEGEREEERGGEIEGERERGREREGRDRDREGERGGE
jgi:hypothetical protein